MPRRLRDFPGEGKVVVANPADENAAWDIAEREDVGYHLDPIVPSDHVYLMNLDTLRFTEL